MDDWVSEFGSLNILSQESLKSVQYNFIGGRMTLGDIECHVF